VCSALKGALVHYVECFHVLIDFSECVECVWNVLANFEICLLVLTTSACSLNRGSDILPAWPISFAAESVHTTH
jgi:hypothetical protein